MLKLSSQTMFNVPKSAPAEKKPKLRLEDDWISDVVGALCDPIIVWPSGGWQDTIPEWLKARIPLDRLIMNMKVIRGGKPTATDSEALIYMMPLTLERPIDSEWTKIYMYLTTKVCSAEGKVMPEDIRLDLLDDNHMGMLQHLKDWIYERRIRTRKDEARQARRKEKEQAKQEIEDQQYKFDF